MKKEIRIGIFLLAAYLIITRFTTIPVLFSGGIFGLAICHFIMGMLPERWHSSIQSFKVKLFRLK